MVSIKHTALVAGIAAISCASLVFVEQTISGQTVSYSSLEEGFEDADQGLDGFTLDPYAGWTRPDGPIKVAIQIGHLETEHAPEELENLRKNTGATGGDRTEVQVNKTIAEAVKRQLETDGIVVELLPVTIPPDYWADIFISIHADGNTNSSISGFKIAAPRRDRTGKASSLVAHLESAYKAATKMDIDPNITPNMRGYYAFNWRRYEHSIHPMTVAAIVETGFLTSPADRRIIVSNPELSAQGITQGIRMYLAEQVPGFKNTP